MKKILSMFSILCILAMLMLGCSSPTPDSSSDTSDKYEDYDYKDYNIVGKYKCDNRYFKQFEEESPEYISAINFYEDGTCLFHVYYIGGIANLNGVYDIDNGTISVKVDLKNTVLETPPDSEIQYMDDQYVFSITDENTLAIDRGCYVIDADDSFIKVSSEPDALAPEPEYDILGTYLCSGDQYNGQPKNSIPYIKFYKEGKCQIYAALSDEDKYFMNESNEQCEIEDSVSGKYHFGENCIYITDLYFFPVAAEVDVHPLKKVFPEEFVCTIVDDESIVIDKGFYKVNDGDTFVRVDKQ